MLPVEIPGAGELVDLDGVPEAGEVYGVQLLLHQRQVVPDQPGLNHLPLLPGSHHPLPGSEKDSVTRKVWRFIVLIVIYQTYTVLYCTRTFLATNLIVIFIHSVHFRRRK